MRLLIPVLFVVAACGGEPAVESPCAWRQLNAFSGLYGYEAAVEGVHTTWSAPDRVDVLEVAGVRLVLEEPHPDAGHAFIERVAVRGCGWTPELLPAGDVSPPIGHGLGSVP